MAFCGVVQVVTAHGICHLLGYRHETEEEWNEVGHILSRLHFMRGLAVACHNND